ncbi:MAG: tetratricopeptide repeat protein [Bacteroidota bacterium]|nr:tetratricopeptide repeat protein [Bacteroidota bacterium]
MSSVNRKEGGRAQNTAIEDHSQVKPLLLEIDNNFRKGKYAAVIKCYDKIREVWPSVTFTMGKIALSYYQIKKYEQAIAYLERSFLREKPGSEKIILLANCYRELGDFRQAVHYYMLATNIDEAQFQLGILHLTRDEYIKALHCFYRVVGQHACHAGAWLKIAEIWTIGEMQNLDEAEFYCMKSLNLMCEDTNCDPANLSDAFMQMLKIIQMQGQPRKAEYLLNRLEEQRTVLKKYYQPIHKAVTEVYKSPPPVNSAFAFTAAEMLESILSKYPTLSLNDLRKHFDVTHYFAEEPVPQLNFVEGK